MRATSHLVVTSKPDRWALKWEQDGRIAGPSPVAFGILWAAGDLGGKDVSGSQSHGMMTRISLVLRENEQSESGTGTSPSPSSSPGLVTKGGGRCGR